MVTNPTSADRHGRARAIGRGVGIAALYALMLLAVLAMWKTNAPPFIYVAF